MQRSGRRPAFEKRIDTSGNSVALFQYSEIMQKGVLALAPLLARKPWIVPIPGTTKLHRLEENLGSADVTLTADDLAHIQRTLATVVVQGDRHTPAMQKMINR